MKRYKTTIVIWTNEDTTGLELDTLENMIQDHEAVISSSDCVKVEHPEDDGEWADWFEDCLSG